MQYADCTFQMFFRRLSLSYAVGNDYVACFAPTSPPPVVNVYQLRDGLRIRSIQGHSAPSISGRFSPDGSCLATWELQGPIRPWKMPIEAAP
jgi:WD40 repeat protein